jgi:hypothetical protein
MQTLCLLTFLTGAYPLWRAWRANRHTSLREAVLWGIGSWLAWGGALLAETVDAGVHDAIRYPALCLTACAGVAVLGARWPGAAAWNFVVLGLLAVLLLPLAESLLLGGEQHRGGVRALFLAIVLAVGVLNYLPTRRALAALLVGAGCALNLGRLCGTWTELNTVSDWPLALAPWAAFDLFGRTAESSEVDRLWLDFRDRFGAIWALRLSEQFNHAAANAGWPVVLSWHGLQPATRHGLPDPSLQPAVTASLRALLKRFGDPHQPEA